MCVHHIILCSENHILKTSSHVYHIQTRLQKAKELEITHQLLISRCLIKYLCYDIHNYNSLLNEIDPDKTYITTYMLRLTLS